MNSNTWDRLRQSMLTHLSSKIRDFSPIEGACESPIEEMLLNAILLSKKMRVSPYAAVSIYGRQPVEYAAASHKEIAKSLNDLPIEARALIVECQPQLEGWRPDFMLHWNGFFRLDGELHRWRSLIVECDGHDFHERTPEQATRDRSRDRAAQLSGFPILRFTGAEIWRDPIGCVEQINRWCRGEGAQ